MTLYQRSYAKKLTGSDKTTYVNSVYDTYSETANTSTSKYASQKETERGNVHAYTRKLTVLNNGTPA